MQSNLAIGDIVRIWHTGDRCDHDHINVHNYFGMGVIVEKFMNSKRTARDMKIHPEVFGVLCLNKIAYFERPYWRLEKVL